MKKTLFVSLIAMAAAVSFSCNKEEADGGEKNPAGQGETGLFASQSEISASSAATKTVLDGVSIKWEEDDAITLFGEDGSPVKYTISEGAGTTSGLFGTDAVLPEKMTGYAVYPSVEASLAEGNSVPVYVATDQSYTATGFPAEYPMAAVSEDGKNFLFENLATVASFTLSGDVRVKSVTLTAEGEGAAIAGNATVDFSGAVPVLKPGQDASNTVSVALGDEGMALSSEGSVFRFIVIPGTYSLSLTVTETNNNVTTKKLGSEALTLNAGSVAEFKVPLEIVTPQGWNITGSFGDMNWGASWIDMKDAHGLIYAEGLEVPDGGLFKIRYAGSEWYGGQVDNTPGVEALCTIVPNSQMENITHINTDTRTSANMTIAEGKYNIYFDYWAFGNDSERYHYLWAMTEGTPFGVVGNCTGSGWEKNIPMVIKNGWLMAEGVEFTEQGLFKIRFGETWDAIFELGSDNEETVREIGSPVTVIRKRTDYHSQNITVPAGTYDIYLDFNRVDSDQYKQTVWIMPQGEVPGEN